MDELTYNADVFAVPDVDVAKRVILTGTASEDTDARWQKETPYLASLLGDMLQLQQGQVIVDYGCGIGRLSKALIERYGCRVLGVDISVQMRGLAPGYVQGPGFSVVSRYVLQGLVERGFRADAGIAVWVLQHCIDPTEDILLLRSALSPQAPLAVVNMRKRAVPSVEQGWRDDGQDVSALLRRAFPSVSERELDPEAIGPATAGASVAMLLHR